MVRIDSFLHISHSDALYVGLSNVFTVLENSPMTMDYRTDRVRVIVNQAGIVTQVPRTG